LVKKILESAVQKANLKRLFFYNSLSGFFLLATRSLPPNFIDEEKNLARYLF